MKYIIIISIIFILFVTYRYYISYVKFNKLLRSIDIRLLKSKNLNDLKPLWFDIIKLHNLSVTKSQKKNLHKLVNRLDDINGYFFNKENNNNILNKI